MDKIPEQLVVLWVKYEDITMHFNELLIKLRTQALGGVATIVTAAGFLVNRESASPGLEPWGTAAVVCILLLLAWITLWIIDVRYYNRLLRGAVVALLEIEELTEGRIKFSHTVEEVVRKKKGVSVDELRRRPSWHAHLFYLLIAVFLIAALFVACWQWRVQPLKRTSAAERRPSAYTLTKSPGRDSTRTVLTGVQCRWTGLLHGAVRAPER